MDNIEKLKEDFVTARRGSGAMAHKAFGRLINEADKTADPVAAMVDIVNWLKGPNGTDSWVTMALSVLTDRTATAKRLADGHQ